MSAAEPIAAETLGVLQQVVLAAVLSGQPIGGTAHRAQLPDLRLALREASSVPLSTENLAAGSIDLGALPRPVQLVGAEEAARNAARPDGAAFLAFRPAVVDEGGGVRLTLEVRAAPPGAGAERALPTSAVQVRFRRSDGRWEVAEPPLSVAN
jgi:hypothetical protein